MSTNYNPLLLCDFYKISHVVQYPPKTEYVYSTWIARGSRIEGVNHAVAFGFQAFIKEYLISYFNENFFLRAKEEVVGEYARLVRYALHVESPKVDHIEALHDLGYLPILIRAVAEGTLVPTRVPMLTIENTDPRFFWLTNALETLMSAEFWQPITTATIAHTYRGVLNEAALATTGTTEGVAYQAHDFSFRGMAGVSAAAASACAHLLSFEGTDTIPGILFAEKYYNANIETESIGTSIPATEHSVMCAYGQDERTSFARLITEVYPEGFISIVSDTYDLWNVLTVTLPSLKEEVMARNGRVVIRPDSGDPVDIICGTSSVADSHGTYSPEERGVVSLLWDTFGGTTNEKGYKVLDSHIGTIYGDSITVDRAREIARRLEERGFASTNVVLGVGSYSYQYVTRDTLEQAQKATWVVIDGVEHNIFKDPATDVKKIKKSLTGRVVVLRGPRDIYAVDGLSLAEAGAYEDDLLQPIFHNGELLVDLSFAEVRATLAAG